MRISNHILRIGEGKYSQFSHFQAIVKIKWPAQPPKVLDRLLTDFAETHLVQHLSKNCEDC